MTISTVAWKGNALYLLDQTKLPGKVSFVVCRNVRSVFDATRRLAVRGAPAIGVAAAFGLYLGVRGVKTTREFLREVKRVSSFLQSARPTAVNLKWALERMKQCVRDHKALGLPRLKAILLDEAKDIYREEKKMCEAMARFGATLIRRKESVLTHCNAGALATVGTGTALAPLYQAKKDGKKVNVFVPETRPLLQGARLTAWELQRAGLPVTVVCDSVVGDLFRRGKVDKVFVGADRVARNGDTANKIGTYTLASLAKSHRVPFYVVAPRSTFDFSTPSGKAIPIEERSPSEVVEPFGVRTAPKGVNVYNPAFDVTPADFITAFVTDEGIFYPPYTKSLQKLRGGKK